MFTARWAHQAHILLKTGLLLALVQPCLAQTPKIILSIEARDALPGFRKVDEADYLASQMRTANPSGRVPRNALVLGMRTAVSL